MSLLRLWSIFCLLLPLTTLSAEYRHMISVNSSGFGWSGSVERINTNNGSAFERVEYFLHNIGLNYAYRFNEDMQLGGFYQTWHQEYKFHASEGGTTSSDLETHIYGVFLLYNFSQEINESYFIGLSTSFYNYEEENSGDFKDAENKDPFELDDTGVTYELVWGRRFSLMKWNIDHLTYSPQIGVFHRTHGKDFDDQKIADGVGFNILAIKFDFLF